MIYCPSCNGNFPDNYIFCLNCGYLLRNYRNIQVSSSEDFSNQMVDKLSNATDEFQTIMEKFSRELDRHSDEMNKSSDDFSLGGIPYNQHVSNLREILRSLSVVFEEAIVNLQDVMFEFLVSLYALSQNELEDGEAFVGMIDSFAGLINSAKSAKSSFISLTLPEFDSGFDDDKKKLLELFDEYIVLFESGVRELKYIKDKCIKNNYMTNENNHNHFCIYCGAKLVPNQHFCSQCGKEVYHEPEAEVVKVSSKYKSEVDRIEQEYNSKQEKAAELVEKLFDPTHMSYSKFMNAIKKSNQLFANQLKITQRMMELDSNKVVDREIENKIKTLNTFVDKMEELINELVIQLSSNKKDNDDINNLFNDMDDLIGSVKDY